MDPFKIIGLLPTILRLVTLVKGAVSTGLSFKTIIDLLRNSEILDIFKKLGEQIFPDVHPDLQASAAVVATYSPEYVMWVQNAANRLVEPPPGLDVDGHYGPRTQAAVKAMQTKLGMAVVDGWVGDVTKAAVTAALAKLDVATLTTPAVEVPKV